MSILAAFIIIPFIIPFIIPLLFHYYSFFQVLVSSILVSLSRSHLSPLPSSLVSLSPTSLGSTASQTRRQHTRPSWRLIGRERLRPGGGRRPRPRWCCVLQPIREQRQRRGRSLSYSGHVLIKEQQKRLIWYININVLMLFELKSVSETYFC